MPIGKSGELRRNGLRIAKNTIKVLGVIYLVLFFIFAIKIINGDTCGRTTYSEYGFGALQEAFTMDAANERVYQNNPFPRDKNIKDWRFCFTTNATDALELHVVDSADMVLGHVIIEDGYHHHCYNVVFPDNETYNYIGLECLTCSASNPKVTVYEEILGVSTERVIKTGNTFTTTEENTLDFVLYGYPSCWESVKYFTIWYLTGAIFILVIIGLIFGLKKTEDIIKKND